MYHDGLSIALVVKPPISLAFLPIPLPVPANWVSHGKRDNWLAWTQAELAERAKVGLSTVKDYESAKRTPIANNLEAIQRALEAGGMQFGTNSIEGPISKSGS